jgi:hypothetical protein
MPKSIPLSRRHRRSRQSNLCNLLSIEHNHVSTTRIVSNDNIVNSCNENDTEDVVTSRQVNPIVSLSSFFDSFSSLDKIENTDISGTSLSGAKSVAATKITPSRSNDGYTNTRNQFLRRSLPSVCLPGLADNSSCAMKTELISPSNTTFEKQIRPRSCSIESTRSHEHDIDCCSSLTVMSPWGQFVDMQKPGDDEVSHFTTSPGQGRRPVFVPGSLRAEIQKQPFGSWCDKLKSIHYSYPQENRSNTEVKYHYRRSSQSMKNRVPLSFSTRFRHSQTDNNSLEEFILVSPDVEEATYHLGSLSF